LSKILILHPFYVDIWLKIIQSLKRKLELTSVSCEKDVDFLEFSCFILSEMSKTEHCNNNQLTKVKIENMVKVIESTWLIDKFI